MKHKGHIQYVTKHRDRITYPSLSTGLPLGPRRLCGGCCCWPGAGRYCCPAMTPRPCPFYIEGEMKLKIDKGWMLALMKKQIGLILSVQRKTLKSSFRKFHSPACPAFAHSRLCLASAARGHRTPEAPGLGLGGHRAASPAHRARHVPGGRLRRAHTDHSRNIFKKIEKEPVKNGYD